jgi:predicted enzyme related to lactoylglutathione lyase
MNSPVTWFEINTANPDPVGKFYADIFGWGIQDVDGGYKIVDTGESGINGGIGKAQGPNQVVFYIEVSDPQATLDEIETKGGRTVVPVTEIPNMVTFAQFADPDGNIVGIVKSA